MKTSGEVEAYLHSLLTSALDGDEWSALRPGRSVPWDKSPRTQRIGGWVGPRVGLDAVSGLELR
jgi:hypothetical protein